MLSIFNFSRICCCFAVLTLLTLFLTASTPGAELDGSLTNNAELCAVQPRGFVAWYKGEGNLSDSTGTSGSGGIFNGTYLPGKVGQAFDFNGVDNYAALRANDNIENKITLAAWINPTAVNEFQSIVSRFNANIPNASSFQFSLIGGKLYFQVNQNDQTSRSYITGNSVIRAGVYQHVAASFNPSTQLTEIYVDGASVPLTLVNSGTVTSFPMLTSDAFTRVTLGALSENATSNNQYFSGRIDEVLMFRRVLSATEIQSIYDAGNIGLCNTFNVSGRITTANGRPLEIVPITTAGGTKTVYSSEVSGGYFIKLDEDHDHTITPRLSTHSFTPSSYSFNPLTADQTGKDFIATLINDNFTGAVELTGEFGDIDGNNQDATRETGEPLHAGVVGGTSVWYRWRAPRSGQFTFSLEGSRFDTLLAVYRGNSVTNLTAIAVNDNIPTATSSRVTFTTEGNTDYYIAVDGRASGGTGAGYFKMIYFPADNLPGFTVSGSVTINNLPVTVVKAENLNGDIIAFARVDNDGKYSIVIPQGINNFKLTVSNQSEFDPEIFTNITQNRIFNFLLRIDDDGNGGGVIIIGTLSVTGLNSTSDLNITVSGTNIAGLRQCNLILTTNGVNFTCPGLLPYGTYTITPSHPVHTFSPGSRTITLGNSNILNASFINNDAPGFTISGRVRQGDTPLNRVIISVSSQNPAAGFTTETDVNGNYSIGPLPAGRDYRVSASLPGFNFQSSVTSFTNLQSNQTVNFSAVSNCSYTLSEIQQAVPAGGGFYSFGITANPGCEWEAKTSSAGIVVTSLRSSGNGTISYFVEPNSGAPRTGTITIAGQTFTISQLAGKSRKRIRFF